MVLFLPLLPCESSVSLKKTLIEKKSCTSAIKFLSSQYTVYFRNRIQWKNSLSWHPHYKEIEQDWNSSLQKKHRLRHLFKLVLICTQHMEKGNVKKFSISSVQYLLYRISFEEGIANLEKCLFMKIMIPVGL